MGNKITGNNGATLGINSSADMHEKLKFESSRLKKDWHNAYDSFNFIVTAWHLFHDWPKSEDSSYLSQSKRNKGKLPEEMGWVLDIVRDLCNGSKHLILVPKAAGNRRIDEIHSGETSNWLEFCFHETIPGISVDNSNWYFSIRVLHNLTMFYFKWVFDDKKPLNDFPPELIEAILYCDLRKRTEKPLSPDAKKITGTIVKH